MNPVIEVLSQITGQRPKDTAATKVNIFELLDSSEDAPSNNAKNTSIIQSKHQNPTLKENQETKSINDC